MEIEIFVSETGRWIVANWPKETEENAHILERLREEEADSTDTVDTNVFRAGKHRVRVVFHAEPVSYEYPQELDCWTTFEPIKDVLK